MRDEGVEDKGDIDLRKGRESQDGLVRGFVFEDGGDPEISVVLSRGVAGQGEDNSVALMCQYQVILGSMIIHTFLNGSCWASS